MGGKNPRPQQNWGLRLHGQQHPPTWCCCPPGYLWDNNQVVVEWLKKHMQEDEGTKSAIWENIKYLKRDYVVKHIRR